MPVFIRPGAERDLPALTAIYNHYVVETAITFDIEPFTVETRRPWFEAFAETGRYRLFVAEEDETVLGYAASIRYRPKPAYRTSVETTVYLRPEATGRAIGSSLYEALFEALAEDDLHCALAGITLPNPASLALHARFRFVPVGVYREVGYKLNRYWDVEWFQKKLKSGLA